MPVARRTSRALAEAEATIAGWRPAGRAWRGTTLAAFLDMGSPEEDSRAVDGRFLRTDQEPVAPVPHHERVRVRLELGAYHPDLDALFADADVRKVDMHRVVLLEVGGVQRAPEPEVVRLDVDGHAGGRRVLGLFPLGEDPGGGDE